jgi:hypothetical protein
MARNRLRDDACLDEPVDDRLIVLPQQVRIDRRRR